MSEVRTAEEQVEQAQGEGAEAAVTDASLTGGRKIVTVLIFCLVCVLINYIGSQIATLLNTPFYFDNLGIILSGAFGGYIPGIVVGYATNFATSINDPMSFYYCVISVLNAIVVAYGARRGWFDKIPTVLLVIVVLAFIGGVLGSVITWFLYGPGEGVPATAQAFLEMVGNNFLIDLGDKGITVAVAVIIMRLLPKKLTGLLDLTIWQQAPLEGERLEAVRHVATRGFSLRMKIVCIVAAVMVIVAVVTTGISYVMFHGSSVDSQTKVGQGVTNLLAAVIDADQIGNYMTNGEDTPGYKQTEKALADIRDSFDDVQYVYVYKIMEDGCHVVFDPDTADEQGSDMGDVLEFEDAFMPYVDDLLAGKPIDPIISNDAYGWLLTVYQPVYDSQGYCTCYVAADISMEYVMTGEQNFLARVIILFLAFFILICAVAIWLAEYGIIMPINSIAQTSSSFAFDSESTRDDSVEQLRALDVKTADEVENLYTAVVKMSEDTVQFITDANEQAATIERMQENLIMVMADLVESRDQYTGDHVRKTAAYTKITMEQMRREGMYSDELTDEFISNVVKSAPLHDVGKIVVSDTILNKPGRLTDEEFELMKRHTLAGAEILEGAKGAVSEGSYLDEACRLAAYHHEKWNGRGYPYGLSGEDIPLSARIMAVADVFDALVSKRSYKDGMPIEKALDIIRKDAGSHFDPLVAQAFLHAEAEARVIASQHGDDVGTGVDIRDA